MTGDRAARRLAAFPPHPPPEVYSQDPVWKSLIIALQTEAILMARTRSLANLTAGLGIASLIALALSHLALTDIWHAEGDLTLEWNVLRVSALVFTAFILSTFASLKAISRT